MSGECVVSGIYDAGEAVGCRVEQADPLIHISKELLKYPGPFIESGEGLVVINARNGTFRYRLLTDEGDRWSAQRIDKTWLPDTA